jgi:hypothetical protein
MSTIGLGKVNDLSLIPKTLGEFLGEGRKRAVYAHPDRGDLVVKKLRSRKKGANRREKRMFDALKGRDEQKWLARVYAISDDGTYLVQERLVMLGTQPESIPDWMAETGPRHWGLSCDGHLKLCDFESFEQRKRFTNKFGVRI